MFKTKKHSAQKQKAQVLRLPPQKMQVWPSLLPPPSTSISLSRSISSMFQFPRTRDVQGVPPSPTHEKKKGKGGAGWGTGEEPNFDHLGFAKYHLMEHPWTAFHKRNKRTLSVPGEGCSVPDRLPPAMPPRLRRAFHILRASQDRWEYGGFLTVVIQRAGKHILKTSVSLSPPWMATGLSILKVLTAWGMGGGEDQPTTHFR